MKTNRKIVTIIIFIIVLSVVGIIATGKTFSTEKVGKSTTKEKSSIKNVDKNEDKRKNKVDDSSQEEKIENNESIEDVEETTSNYNSISNNNSSSTSNATQNITESNTNNTTIQESIDSNTTNSNVQTTPQISTPQTEWEKLGISEYDYYHTPMNNGEEVAFESDTSVCTAEINRLVNIYFKDGLSGGNSYSVNGKYTYSYIGCGINIFINGVSYKYSQVMAMGYK